MIKESAFAEKDNRAEESAEYADGFSEETVKNLLETHHTISNTGTKGIILKFLKDELPPHVQEMMKEDKDDNAEGSLAIKALKIYALGDAQKEYELLKSAREIAINNADGTPTARVPRTSGFYNISAGAELRDTLNKNGAYIGPDGKVGLIIMDFIEGADLATILYREVLKRTAAEDDPYPPDMIDTLPFEELHRTVAQKLEFARPGGKSRNESERIFEEDRVKNENAKKLFHVLEKNGFVLPEEILSQVENTVARFHKNSLYHNDLHERNIIVKDADLEHPQTYIIDFGSAAHREMSSDDPSQKPMDDNSVIKRLRPLTKTADAKRRESINEISKEWESRLTAFDSNPRMKAQYEQIENAFTEGNGARMDAQFGMAISTDTNLEIFLSALLKISREHADSKVNIIDFLTSQEHKKTNRGFVIKRIQQWKESVGKE